LARAFLHGKAFFFRFLSPPSLVTGSVFSYRYLLSRVALTHDVLAGLLAGLLLFTHFDDIYCSSPDRLQRFHGVYLLNGEKDKKMLCVCRVAAWVGVSGWMGGWVGGWMGGWDEGRVSKSIRMAFVRGLASHR